MVNPANERSAVCARRLRLVNSPGQRSLLRFLDILLDAIKATAVHFIQAIEYESRDEGSEHFTELTRLCATLRRLEVQGFVGRATERPTEALVRTTHCSKGALRGPTR